MAQLKTGDVLDLFHWPRWCLAGVGLALATIAAAQGPPGFDLTFKLMMELDHQRFEEEQRKRQIELQAALDASDAIRYLETLTLADYLVWHYKPKQKGQGTAPAPKAAPGDGAPVPFDFTYSRACPAARASVITPDGRFLYAASDDVCAFALDGTTLVASAVPGMPFRGGRFVRSLALDRSARYLYTANQDSNDISGYAIDQATGALTPVPGSPFAAGSEPFAIAVDGSGRFAYVANNTGTSVSAYRIDIDTGALTPVPGSPFTAPERPWAIAADPTGRYLYVAGIGLQAYRIDAASGALAPAGAPVSTSNFIAKGIAVDPSGRFVYATWGFADQSGVSAFSIGATGGLTAVGPRLATGDSPLAVAVAVSGAYVYVANPLNDSLSGFHADAVTGALSPIAGSPFPVGRNPKGLFASGNLPAGVSIPAGVRFGRPLGIAGGRPPYSFAVAEGALPAGLGLDAGTGFLSGTPASTGVFTFMARATDSVGASATQTYELEVRSASTGVAAAIEYYHQNLDHYFITWIADEVAKLDAGVVIKGWTRTGRSIPVYTAAQATTSPVCRYYIPPALGDSHFFGRGTVECDDTGRKNPSFVLEDAAFMHMTLPTAGVCPAGTIGVYRLFSNRPDANHRYTTDKTTRDAMVAKGWLAEGDGPDLVVMCAPA